jgi:acyl-homoserine-lactone acylase
VSVALMQKPVEALSQSFLRTRARNYAEFQRVAEQMKANSSNNTIFADAEGNIAYSHPHFIPRRDDRFDYTKPVDGSDPATDWKGLHALAEAPHLLNPPNGWIQNTNNWPYSAAGPHSPRRESFPRYMDVAGENPRGIHAIMVLQDKKDFTLESLRAAAYDPYLTAFARLIPTLLEAYDRTPASDPLKARLAEQIGVLRGWDFRWAASSVPTSLAVFWGEEMWGRVGADARRAGMNAYDYIATRATAEQKLQALAAASERLEQDFGRWRTPWGEINRFQRLTGAIVQPFTDAGPQHRGAVHVGAVGLARLLWRAPLRGDEALLRHQRQQLRGRRRVRRQRAGARHHRRRAERRPALAALQRPGGAVRNGQPARGVLLSLAAEGAHREGVPARAVKRGRHTERTEGN